MLSAAAGDLIQNTGTTVWKRETLGPSIFSTAGKKSEEIKTDMACFFALIRGLDEKRGK